MRLDPQKTKEYGKKWQQENREKFREYSRNWRKKNPEKVRAKKLSYYHRNKAKARAQSRKWYLLNREKIRSKQGLPPSTRPCPKNCECCGKEPSGHFTTLFLDHCHVTGKFRGWLCGGCNRGIGLLGDNEESIKKALDYLVRNRCS